MATSKTKDPEATALVRADAIMKVRSGIWTAAQAAAALGVSRKTYYKWEGRGLAALLESLGDQPAGRPRQGVSEREVMLETQLNHLQRDYDLLRQRMALKELVWQMNDRPAKGRRGKK
jgi:transposase